MIRAAAELARILGLALHGFFLQDAALSDLAALPFVREFRLGNGGWHKLDSFQLAEEQRAAASEAQRLLNEIADTLGVAWLFEVISGDPALLLAATSQAGDIIVVAQPRLPAERLVRATAGWLEAAHGCVASVMLVPPTPIRNQGPVAAVVCSQSDPALTIAARIAKATDEALLLLIHGPSHLGNDAAEQARAAGLPVQRINLRSIPGVLPDDVLQALGTNNERLVVLARGACGADDAAISSRIAESRGVPVLVVDR